jgi:hypothetical protein
VSTFVGRIDVSKSEELFAFFNWHPSPIPRGTRLRDFNLSCCNEKAVVEDFTKTTGIRE